MHVPIQFMHCLVIVHAHQLKYMQTDVAIVYYTRDKNIYNY